MNEQGKMSPNIRTAVYSSLGAVAAYLLTRRHVESTVPAVIFGQMTGTIIAEVQNQREKDVQLYPTK